MSSPTSPSTPAASDRSRAAAARMASGSRLGAVGALSSSWSSRTRSAAREAVARSRSAIWERANHRSPVAASVGRASSAAASSSRARSTAVAGASSTSARRAISAVSSASRASAWMTAARRAVSACRPSGPSWRRISPMRSVNRVRLASIDSSLRRARSLRFRCLRTPAASSMKPRRSSGVARRMASSWPWPTMTCISRPMPESESSSWMSRSRQLVPLMAYSEPPERNIVRDRVTSV